MAFTAVPENAADHNAAFEPTGAVDAAAEHPEAASASHASAASQPSSSSATVSDSFYSVTEGPQALATQPPADSTFSPTLSSPDRSPNPKTRDTIRTPPSDPGREPGPASLRDTDDATERGISPPLASPDTSGSLRTAFAGDEPALDAPTSGALATSLIPSEEESPSPTQPHDVLNRATLERLAAGDGSLVTVEVLAALAPLYVRSGAQVFADLASQHRKLFVFFKTLKAESAAWDSLRENTRERALGEKKDSAGTADEEWENDNGGEWESDSIPCPEGEVENQDVFSESRLLWSKLPKLRQSKVKERVFAVASTLLQQVACAEAAACATDTEDFVEQPLQNATLDKAHNPAPPGHSRRPSTAIKAHHSPSPPLAAASSSRVAAGLFTEHFDWVHLTPALQAIYDRQGHRQEVIDGKTFWTFITRCTLQPLKDACPQPAALQPSAPETNPSLRESLPQPARVLQDPRYQESVIEEVDADEPLSRSALAYQHSETPNLANRTTEDESDDEDHEDEEGGLYNTEQLQQLMEALLKNMPSRPDETKTEGECQDGTEDPEEERRIQAFTQLLLMQMGIHADGEGAVAHGPVDEETEKELKLRHLVQERRRDPARQHLADMWEELLREEDDEPDLGQEGLENTGDGQRYALGSRSYTGLGLRDKFRCLKRRLRERHIPKQTGCSQTLND